MCTRDSAPSTPPPRGQPTGMVEQGKLTASALPNSAQPAGIPAQSGSGHEPEAPHAGTTAPAPAAARRALGSAASLIRQAIRGRMPRAVVIGLVALGLILIGAGIGRLLFPVRAPGETSPIVIPTASPGDRSGVVMPDISGLTVDHATRVLSDAGLLRPAVASETIPQAGPAGLVVVQTPAAGSSVPSPEGVAVALKVSGPGAIPDLSGKTLDAARDALSSLGVVPTIDEVVKPDQAPGVVIATVPAAGQPLAPQVTVSVATAGDGIYLSDVRDVSRSGCGKSSSEVANGQTMRSALVCTASARTAASAEYTLGRHAVVLDAQLGISDRASAPGPATVTILADGAKAGSVTVAPGALTPVHLSMAGVLRLRLEVTTTSTSGLPVVLGEVRVVGAPDDIALLAAQNG